MSLLKIEERQRMRCVQCLDSAGTRVKEVVVEEDGLTEEVATLEKEEEEDAIEGEWVYPIVYAFIEF